MVLVLRISHKYQVCVRIQRRVFWCFIGLKSDLLVQYNRFKVRKATYLRCPLVQWHTVHVVPRDLGVLSLYSIIGVLVTHFTS